MAISYVRARIKVDGTTVDENLDTVPDGAHGDFKCTPLLVVVKSLSANDEITAAVAYERVAATTVSFSIASAALTAIKLAEDPPA